MNFDSLFQSYFKEREDVESIANDKGFVLYKFEGDKIVYISDVFVKKEYRKSNVATELANQVCVKAKNLGCDLLIGSVDVTTNNYETSINVLMSYGMQEFKQIGNMIYFKKELI